MGIVSEFPLALQDQRVISDVAKIVEHDKSQRRVDYALWYPTLHDKLQWLLPQKFHKQVKIMINFGLIESGLAIRIYYVQVIYGNFGGLENWKVSSFLIAWELHQSRC